MPPSPPSEDVAHFLEGIGTDRPLPFHEKASVLRDAFYRPLELRAGLEVPVRAGESGLEEVFRVGVVQCFPVAVESGEPFLEQGADLLQGQFRIICLSGQPLQGSRIHQFARKGGLVQVQADADDAVDNPVALQTVLDEHSADLPFSDIDVIGPLDDGRNAFVPEPIADDERGQERETHVIPGREPCRFQEEGERQVVAGFRKPAVSPLSTARRLVNGGDH